MYLVRSPQPLTKETANANAATAAASAFKRRASDASLSSAAAAAALRARPTSPTVVADIQSKRLSRRSPSVSSTTGRRRELTRTPSVGSMMDRTFRSPSPGRSPAPVPHDVPPIPSIPGTDNYKPSSRPSSSSRRGGVGLQTQNFRTASEKMRDGQKGSWFGAATAQDLHTVRRTASELQLTSTRSPSEPRPGSVSPSINFSYPRARLHSPNGSLRSLQLDDQTLVYDPNSRRMVPRAQLEARSQAIYEEDYEPIKEKPKAKKATKQPKEPKPPRLSRAGSHLSRGTVGRTKAPALESNETEQSAPIIAPEPDLSLAAEPEADAAPPKPKAKKKKKEQTQALGTTEPDSMTAEMPSSSVAAVSAVDLASAVSENGSAPPPTGKKAAKSSKNAASATPSPNAKSKVKVVASREPSESPARSARFAASTDQLLVRHEPPPRSLSPRKSALKQASPTRAVSPSDDGSEVSGVPGSLTPNDDVRKKSFRVSWDDRNTVVVSEPTAQHAAEQAASSSPQTKKLWHGIVGKGKRKDAAPLETEETMSPRPALPSFGSVREKKPKEQEERPLVRPEHAMQIETSVAAVASSPISAAHLNTSKEPEVLPIILPSVERDEHLSSSEDGLMEDTSDDNLDSDAEVSHTATNGTATKKSAIANGVPGISVSQSSPGQSQTDKHEHIVPARVDEDDVSSGGEEDLEEEDAHSHATGLPMDDIKEEEEEGDTYIDAYEEIDEPEGDGFQSLDAVLESPTSSPTAKSAKEKSITEDAIPEATEATNNKSDSPDDWENAKAYWKSLSAAKRRQLEQEAMAEAGDEHQDLSKAPKIDIRTSPKTDAQNITPKKERSYQIAPGTIQQAFESTPEATPTNSLLKANGNSMRKSMRDSQYNEAPSSDPTKLGGSLRKTLRSERPASAGNDSHPKQFAEPSSPTSPSRMKRSLRHNSVDLGGSAARPSLSGAGRPASYHAATDSPSSLKHFQTLRVNGSASPVSATRGAVIKSSLRRRGSDSSESSFTRARAGTSGGHEFRRSMRGSMREPPATSDGLQESNRFGMRPSSPPAMAIRRNSVSSLPPTANFGAGRMRHSLRGASADPPTRRRMPGFGKSATKARKGKGGSRFGDSSDEDEGPANFFRSRFADSSSDDDEPQTKSKGRGLPKSLRAKSNGRPNSSAIQNGRESPSMFDNAVLTQPKRTEAVGSSLGVSGSGLLPPQTDDIDGSGRGSLRPQHNRRGSFISLLRRKKDSSNKITRDVSESAARQDTHLERSPQELEALRNTSMHKRGPSWPLPEPEETATGADHSPERPSTAGGAIVSTSSNKSKFARRRSASHGMVAADTADIGDDDDLVTDAVPQKKKKFGALRKMFGLHD
ncbi:hypothetical protein PWT90_03118 [Aphanocladium album]|nr:hypothetical protein PWT90_03118 [Aphanocladium album]